MGVFLIVDKASGEVEVACAQCGIVDLGDSSDSSILPVDDAHAVVEVSVEEKDAFAEAQVLGAGGHLEYALRVDMEKAVEKIDQREKIEVPIEVEGIGGKEIIGYDTKPVGIVVERELSTEKK